MESCFMVAGSIPNLVAAVRRQLRRTCVDEDSTAWCSIWSTVQADAMSHVQTLWIGLMTYDGQGEKCDMRMPWSMCA